MSKREKRPSRRRPARGYARGDETRVRIIEAALDVFGSCGYEAATTRAIAEHAAITLPALQYYFGGKEGVYLACAHHVVARLSAQLLPAIEHAETVLASEIVSGDDAFSLLSSLLDDVAELFIASRESDHWASFILREQAHPTAAFDVLYEGIVGRITNTCVVLVSRLLGRATDDVEVRVRALGLLGQYLIFRAAREATLRTLEWDGVNGEQLAQIKLALRAQTAAALTTWPH